MLLSVWYPSTLYVIIVRDLGPQEVGVVLHTTVLNIICTSIRVCLYYHP